MKSLKMFATLLIVVALAGCGAQRLANNEPMALVVSKIQDQRPGSRAGESAAIATVNEKRMWPALPIRKITPGLTSVQLFGACGRMGLLDCKAGTPYIFAARAGRRYELIKELILSSDASKDDFQPNGMYLFRVPVLSKGKNLVLIQSSVTLRGEDATEFTDKVMAPLALIEVGANSSYIYWEEPRNQIESLNKAQQLLVTGLGAGSYYLPQASSGRMTVIMKECKTCKTFAVYRFNAELGKRYELAPKGKIYVSDAYDDNVNAIRKVLDTSQIN